MNAWRLLAFALLATAAGPAFAQGPEQLEQLEPDAGEWQLEYFGFFGSGAEEREHSLQLMAGVSERLVLGVELESEWTNGRLRMAGIAPVALYRFSHASGGGFGLGVSVQAGFDRRLRFTGGEARLMAEKRWPGWWLEADLIVRDARDDSGATTTLAYGAALNRAITGALWLGVEGSGQAARLRGGDGQASGNGQFLGPSLTYELELARDREVEIGVAYLRRTAGAGPRGTARLFVQFGF